MNVSTGSSLRLPVDNGQIVVHDVGPRSAVFDAVPTDGEPPTSRSVFAAGHVVASPLGDPAEQGRSSSIDWEHTLAFRHHLWSLGLGVADAMDTAQRGGGLDWRLAKELIERSGREARSVGGTLACGASTDQLDPSTLHELDRIVGAYLEQVGWITEAGAIPVIMASRHLARTASSADDYRAVYDEVLRQAPVPVFLHWLGEAFDPALRCYWGSDDLDTASETFLSLIEAHADRVDGVKVSLLDARREVELRRRLPASVKMHTGDDFNYVDLIGGDDQGHSDALLGVFDALAVPARAALAQLDDGDPDGFAAILNPTVPLARHVFSAPTSAYKTGVVLLAWLNGHQPHFRMVAAAETRRSIPHLAQTFALADRAGALADPELAAHRMRSLLIVAGVDQ